MKVLLYFEGKHLLSKSGIGRAYDHQRKALEAVDVEYTCELNQTDYDILHINTYGIRSQKVIRKARKNQKKIIIEENIKILLFVSFSYLFKV